MPENETPDPTAPTTIEGIIALHEAEIKRLSGVKATGELDQLAFLAQASPHAVVLAALGREKTRDEVLKWVRFALANPAIVEAVAVGTSHYLLEAARHVEDAQYGIGFIGNLFGKGDQIPPRDSA